MTDSRLKLTDDRSLPFSSFFLPLVKLKMTAARQLRTVRKKSWEFGILHPQFNSAKMGRGKRVGEGEGGKRETITVFLLFLGPL